MTTENAGLLRSSHQVRPSPTTPSKRQMTQIKEGGYNSRADLWFKLKSHTRVSRLVTAIAATTEANSTASLKTVDEGCGWGRGGGFIRWCRLGAGIGAGQMSVIGNCTEHLKR